MMLAEEIKQNWFDLDINDQHYQKLFYKSPAGMLLLDENGYIIKANQAIKEMTGYEIKELVGANIFDLLVLENNRAEAKKNIKRIISGEDLRFITKSQKKSGEIFYSLLKETRIKLNNDNYGVLSMQIDITDLKEKEEKIKYISYSDKLTGLYNRNYFEEELSKLDTPRQLPISIIMADIDGLKLINDTYGHKAGDKIIKRAAEILKKAVRKEDIVSRWAGDEFVILLPQTDRMETEKIIERIIEKTNKTEKHDIPISIGLGYAIKEDSDKDIYKILNKADKNMYHNKISFGRDNESKIIKSFLNSLEKKSDETKEHAQRMAKLARKIGRNLNLKSEQLHKLYLLAYIHDIGKISIPKNILNKKDRLNDREWEMIKTHPLKGKQIALATEEFSPIAEEIYSHHERWDGKGYPRGLKRKEIPYLARIISIVDAYDVMTNKRVYSNAISKEEALKELKACAGTQFDPEIIKVFNKVIAYNI
ncbi:MAG: HD domain-containing phosphohydrolase [Bacillota bacterium]